MLGRAYEHMQDVVSCPPHRADKPSGRAIRRTIICALGSLATTTKTPRQSHHRLKLTKHPSWPAAPNTCHGTGHHSPFPGITLWATRGPSAPMHAGHPSPYHAPARPTWHVTDSRETATIPSRHRDPSTPARLGPLSLARKRPQPGHGTTSGEHSSYSAY